MADQDISPTPMIQAVDTGITNSKTKAIATALSQALADSFTLYLKTLGAHWNVVGPNFYALHKLTQGQYEDLDAAIDLIAERIRALGHIAPASFGDFEASSIVESRSTLTTAENMMTELLNDNEQVAKRMREFVAVADKADDVFTANLLTARIGRHEQNAWMLRSIIA